MPTTYHRTHGVTYSHGCYSVGEDTLWGVNRRRKSAGNTCPRDAPVAGRPRRPWDGPGFRSRARSCWNLVAHADADASGRCAVTVKLLVDGGWMTHATGVLGPVPKSPSRDLAATVEWLAFRGLRALWRRAGEVFAEAALPETVDETGFAVYLALLAVAAQAVVAAEPDDVADVAALLVDRRDGTPGHSARAAGTRRTGRGSRPAHCSRRRRPTRPRAGRAAAVARFSQPAPRRGHPGCAVPGRVDIDRPRDPVHSAVLADVPAGTELVAGTVAAAHRDTARRDTGALAGLAATDWFLLLATDGTPESLRAKPAVRVTRRASHAGAA